MYIDTYDRQVIRDTSLYQTTDVQIWESVTKWALMMEEFIFGQSDKIMSGTMSSITDILHLNRDQNGRWADYTMAQELSDFLDILTSPGILLFSFLFLFPIFTFCGAKCKLIHIVIRI